MQTLAQIHLYFISSKMENWFPILYGPYNRSNFEVRSTSLTTTNFWLKSFESLVHKDFIKILKELERILDNSDHNFWLETTDSWLVRSPPRVSPYFFLVFSNILPLKQTEVVLDSKKREKCFCWKLMVKKWKMKTKPGLDGRCDSDTGYRKKSREPPVFPCTFPFPQYYIIFPTMKYCPTSPQ